MAENTTNYADGRHVDELEARDALDPSIGAGTPQTAPSFLVAIEDEWVGPVKTVGFSPKLIVAIVATVLAYLLTQELVDFPAWAELVLSTVLVGVGVYRASAGTVERA